MNRNSPIEQRIAEECLAGRVRMLSRIISGLYDDALRPYKVRLSQMNILVAVAFKGPVLAVDIGRSLCIEKSTMSRDLERLIERGLVRETVVDGRSKPLEVTEKGRALIRTTQPAWEEAQKQAREILGESLTKELFKTVREIRDGKLDKSEAD